MKLKITYVVVGIVVIAAISVGLYFGLKPGSGEKTDLYQNRLSLQILEDNGKPYLHFESRMDVLSLDMDNNLEIVNPLKIFLDDTANLTDAVAKIQSFDMKNNCFEINFNHFITNRIRANTISLSNSDYQKFWFNAIETDPQDYPINNDQYIRPLDYYFNP